MKTLHRRDKTRQYSRVILFVVLCLPLSVYAQIITTIAGTGTFAYSGNGGPATNAGIGGVNSVVTDKAGNVYLAEGNSTISLANVIRKIDVTGVISTIAGIDTFGFSGDNGPATSARLNQPEGLKIDSAGNIYFADYFNARVRKINSAGIITTIAGNGTNGYSGDNGLATDAELSYPTDIFIDDQGNIFIADAGNNVVRKINSAGIITTVAGNGYMAGTGNGGFSGDGGSATSAAFYGPTGIAIDKEGDLYISDYGNYRIRKVNTLGTVTTIAGNGVWGYSGDGGPATNAKFYQVDDLAIDKNGNVFASCSFDAVIRKIDTAGIVTVYCGTADVIGPGTGDGGPATDAHLFSPLGITLDTTGSLYIADGDGTLIRKVTVGSASVKSIEKNPEFNIFPNPVCEQLTVKGASRIERILIMNVAGRVVYEGVFNAKSVNIDVAGFPAGLYFIKVNNIVVKKFLKQ